MSTKIEKEVDAASDSANNSDRLKISIVSETTGNNIDTDK